MAETLGIANPLRYRGYYYDAELGMYYLQSRYYDPTVGRFINADGLVSTGQDLTGFNMFAYCGNNPIMRSDVAGTFWAVPLAPLIPLIIIIPLILVGCSDMSQSKPYSGQANCYAYALKLENDPRTGQPFKSKPQPGEFSGAGLTSYDMYTEERLGEFILDKVQSDTAELGLTFTPVESYDHKPKSGNWVVALVYASDRSDYHWYRRDEDGTWSHKKGTGPIIYWDESYNTITNPKECDRGIYDVFVGFYEVGPN